MAHAAVPARDQGHVLQGHDLALFKRGVLVLMGEGRLVGRPGGNGKKVGDLEERGRREPGKGSGRRSLH
jgi:hypothetical protein